MKFLNKKEQVIDLQLTQYGKRLLADGDFKPQYYAFYDDDVIYDSEYGGKAEDQYRSEERIFNTARLETQGITSGIETKIKEKLKEYNADQENIKFDKPLLKFQNEADRDMPLMPLGTSEVSNEYFPAWEINVLNGKIDNPVSSSYKSESFNLNIPQIKYDIEYTIERSATKSDEILEEFDGEMETFHGEEDEFFSSGFAESFIVNREHAFLEIKEKNVDFVDENYDIEVYLVQPDNELQRLYFHKEPDQVQNGLLLDPNDPRLKTPDYENNPNYVGYFLDVMVDREIPDSVYCAAKSKDEKENLYFDDVIFECTDEMQTSSRDIYNITDGVYEDPCEE